MPKINVNDEVVAGFRVEVGWNHDQYVQVGTTNEASEFRFEHKAECDDSGEWSEAFHGWFVTLSRDGVNRLIRALRKARDDAFGADA
jgi:hypothetical protein